MDVCTLGYQLHQQRKMEREIRIIVVSTSLLYFLFRFSFLLRFFVSHFIFIIPIDTYNTTGACRLDNNGKIMTAVSNVMTHSLFASSFFSKMMHRLGTLWQQIKKPRKKGTASSSITSSSSSLATRTSTNYKTRWNGKAFFAPSSSTTSKEGNNAGTTVTTARILGRGSNRFERTLRNNMDTTTTTTTTANSSSGSSSSRKQHNNDNAAPVIFTKHDFEYCLQESALGLTTVPPSHTNSDINTNTNTNSNTSLCLKYTNYQAPLSLWYTMQDELRIVTLPKTVLASNETQQQQQQQQQQVLLGIGYMAWSGGIWNASPFVLWRA